MQKELGSFVPPVGPLPDSGWRGLPAMSGTRPSTLAPTERLKLVEKNMPIWFIYPNEPYPAKAWQSYLIRDVKYVKFSQNEGNMRPWEDTRHHNNGNDNPSRPSLHSKGQYTVNYNGKTIQRSAIDPQVAPTYVFYQEMKNGEIWIRYFLFFGYNDPFAFGQGRHYSDWVHLAVKLTQQDGKYLPVLYYYSSHSGGNAFGAVQDSKVQYYKKDGNTFTRTSYQDAKNSDRFRVGLYCAKGSHEVYHQGGTHHATWYDQTDIGDIIDPSYYQSSVERNLDPLYAPYYVWDMSDVTYVPENGDILSVPSVPGRAVPMITHIPRQLAPAGDQYLDNWFRLVVPGQPGIPPKWLLINKCADDEVTSPLLKIVWEWTEFEN